MVGWIRVFHSNPNPINHPQPKTRFPTKPVGGAEKRRGKGQGQRAGEEGQGAQQQAASTPSFFVCRGPPESFSKAALDPNLIRSFQFRDFSVSAQGKQKARTGSGGVCACGRVCMWVSMQVVGERPMIKRRRGSLVVDAHTRIVVRPTNHLKVTARDLQPTTTTTTQGPVRFPQLCRIRKERKETSSNQCTPTRQCFLPLLPS